MKMIFFKFVKELENYKKLSTRVSKAYSNPKERYMFEHWIWYCWEGQPWTPNMDCKMNMDKKIKINK